ncbi:MAG: transcription-repair coupling factor [Candidatus Omnitrophota bacterium]
MFGSIKIYSGESTSLSRLIGLLVEFGYLRVSAVAEEGDFSHKGEIIDIFPATFELPIRIQCNDTVVEKIRSFDPVSGHYAGEHAIAIILPASRLRLKKVNLPLMFLRPIAATGAGEGSAAHAADAPIQNFVDITPGDLVVHVEHGIGIYRGLKRLKRERAFVDHFVIEYLDKELLYVPVGDLHLVQRYIGFEGRPKLYKLGSPAWEKVKEKAKKGVFNLAYELLEFQAKRQALTGFSFSKDGDWQKELEEAFPYDDTPDQARTCIEVKRDMESVRPMDRLICGDVGYGKTEVALRAAFKAVMDNKQVAILVPTTILAEQHYATFSKRLARYPLNVQMLSRFKTAREQSQIVAGVRDGSVDIVIGTHRLVSDDISFKDLGLVIIDEEQRFGVRHKEKLKRFRLLVDVLTLTATPIPRTLYMSLMGAKDLSLINTPPQNRLPVETKIAEYDEALIREALKREIARGGQVFFVRNRIEGIERTALRLRALLPDARVEVGHGQMPERALEETMLRFMKGDVDVLVSTAIVESGIDIPNANTIIVERADMFGLADLYQLRGRVGRFKKKAFAYFLIPQDLVVTRDVEKRLAAIEKFTQLGSGFKIAMEDMQLRGAGNLLGQEQHGYIESVGFDLYCRLLKSAIDDLERRRPEDTAQAKKRSS